MYSEAKDRVLRHDTSAGVSFKANLEDICTKFLLQDIVVHCFCPRPPNQEIKFPHAMSQGFSKVPQNKYIKSNSEILSIKVVFILVLGAWRETVENTVIFLWIRGVFTCTCSCNFLLCSHF